MSIVINKDMLTALRNADKNSKGKDFWEQYKMEHYRKDSSGKWKLIAEDVPKCTSALIYKKVGKQYYMYNKTGTDRWSATLQVRELLKLI